MNVLKERIVFGGRIVVVVLALGLVHGAYAMKAEDYEIVMREKESYCHAQFHIEEWPPILAFDEEDAENRERCDQIEERWQRFDRAFQKETIALWHAVRAASVKGVKEALKRGVDMEHVDFYGVSPLRRAAHDGSSEIITLLLASKAFVDAGDKEGNKTALFCAAERGHIKAAAALLAGRANVNAAANASFDYKRPLMAAAARGHVEMVNLLLIYQAALNSHNAIVSRLLRAGAVVDGAPGAPLTPLMAATEKGNKALMRELIRYRANVNAVADDGAMALACAAALRDPSVAELLLNSSARADIMIGDKSVLYHASAHGCTETAKLFIERGVAIPTVCEGDKVAVQKAFDRGHTDIVTMLLFYGADSDSIAADIAAARMAFDKKQRAASDSDVSAAAATSVSAVEVNVYNDKVAWSAEQLAKLESDIVTVQAVRRMLGEQNWLPEVLLQEWYKLDCLPVFLARSIDAYATQYVTEKHDRLLDRLVKEHIQRVQWLQSQRVDLTHLSSYEPGAILRLELAEKKKMEEEEEKKQAAQQEEQARELGVDELEQKEHCLPLVIPA